jgi:dihydrolipoamide dehydrogenase
MTTEKDTHSDMLVLGGGSGGYSAAFRASQLGLAVTLIEADKVGGTCLHRGCIPTKALVHIAEVAEMASTSSAVGVNIEMQGFNLATMRDYQCATVDRLYTGLLGLVKKHRINVVDGVGEFVGDRAIAVGGATYTGDSIVLATGSRPRGLPGVEIGNRIVASDGALELDFIPQKAVVVGGGVIGAEFASIWRSFGAEVTIVESLRRLIASEDAWSSKQLERAFGKRGIKVLTNTEVISATETDGGVTITTGAGILEADIMLVAIGRQPRTENLGLEEHGIQLDQGFVSTDDRLRTTVNGVYAVGDLVAGLQLAHRGFQHGIFVAEEVAGRAPIPQPEHHFPRVTYSHPEVASVGLTEQAAKERFGDATTVLYDLGGNARSQILNGTGGIKAIHAGTPTTPGPIVGIHMIGPRVSELIGEAQLAVGWEALPDEVAQFIHAHPTQNEALGEAMLALSGRPLHTHA